MATVVLLAPASAVADSADFTIALGSTACIFAKPLTALTELPQPEWELQLMKKTGTDYYTVDRLNRLKPACVIYAAGTYRVHRPGLCVVVGCDQET